MKVVSEEELLNAINEFYGFTIEKLAENGDYRLEYETERTVSAITMHGSNYHELKYPLKQFPKDLLDYMYSLMTTGDKNE